MRSLQVLPLAQCGPALMFVLIFMGYPGSPTPPPQVMPAFTFVLIFMIGYSPPLPPGPPCIRPALIFVLIFMVVSWPLSGSAKGNRHRREERTPRL
jgi:hypothetical protein